MSESRDVEGHIVAGGGWIEEKRCYQPKAALFRMLTILWILPSIGAIVVLCLGERVWFAASGFLEGLRAVKFEDWIAFALLLAHPLFAFLAWRFRQTEMMKKYVVQIANPDHDPRKLY